MAVENKGDIGSVGAETESASMDPNATLVEDGSESSSSAPKTEKGGGTPGGKGHGGGGGGGGGGKGPGKGDGADNSLPAKIMAFQQFLKEVLIEFKKISWPDRAQIFRETMSVLVLVTIITVLVLGFDAFLSKIVFGPIDQWVRTHLGAAHFGP
jgi:preprotein translocase SecE subunit